MATKALTTTSLRLCGDLSFCCDPQNSTAAQQLQKTVWEPAKSINKSVLQWDRIPQLDDSTHHRVSAATQQHSNAAFPPTCWRSRDLQQKTSEFHGMTMEASKWGLSSHDSPWTSSPNTMSASRAHMSSLRECHFGEKMSYLTCWLWLNSLRKFRETFVQRGLFVLKSFWLCM